MDQNYDIKEIRLLDLNVFVVDHLSCFMEKYNGCAD